MGRGLYIHIPFCKQKCNYCDFNSGPYRDQDLERYMELLSKEANLFCDNYGRLAIETVFIGGGTPTVLEPSHIEKLGELIHKNFDLSHCVEFSFEANPESVTKEKIRSYKSIGANRVSIGLQTANDNELFAISRIHDWQSFLDAYRTVRQEGFDNVNIDLMIGLPGQTKKSYMDSLRKVIALEPEHLSTYGLILEEETPLYKQVESGQVIVLEGDVERELYHESKDYLESCGYELYEISNFSKDKKHCYHNVNYWRCGEYVALGVGAHGYLDKVRYENALTLSHYEVLLNEEKRPVIEHEVINLEEESKEYLMLGLRMVEGISLKTYYERFGKRLEESSKALIHAYEISGHLALQEDRLSLTPLGMDISNKIIIDFFESLNPEK